MRRGMYIMIKSILRPGLKVARDVLIDIRNRLGNKSYSQEGEDRVLAMTGPHARWAEWY